MLPPSDGGDAATGAGHGDGDDELDASEQLAKLLRENDVAFRRINDAVQAKPPVVNGRLDGSIVG